MHTYAFHISAQLWIQNSPIKSGYTSFLLTALHRLKNGMGSYGMAGSSHPTLSARDARYAHVFSDSGHLLAGASSRLLFLVHFVWSFFLFLSW